MGSSLCFCSQPKEVTYSDDNPPDTENKDMKTTSTEVAMVELSSSPFTKITKTHSDYTLAISIQNGLRRSITHRTPSDQEPIENADLSNRSKVIAMECSESTIHRFSSMVDENKEQLFTEYAPLTFSKLRRCFNISDDDYLSILTGDDHSLLSFLSNSRSGQYFFFSSDSRFIIKTMSSSELQFLLSILPSYCDYMLNEANSLIARFYGVYKLNKFRMNSTTTRSHDVSFLISNNVFYSPRSDLVIKRQYDLKGSTQGRFTKGSGSILKDVNFMNDGVNLKISNHGKSQLFHSQIEKDSQWFAKNLIMDYSLLIGIADHKEIDDMDRESKSDGHDEKHDEGALNIFYRDYGGMQSDDGTEIYFVGIIDILQKYNKKKKAAAFMKGIKYEKTTLSTVPPDVYAKRFCEFFRQRVS